MRIVIRADASLAIGSGHLMRCLCLADALVACGAEVAFVCKWLPKHLTEVVSQRHSVTVLSAALEPGLNAPQEAWSTARQLEDAASVAALSVTAESDWLVVDHYGLDHTW